MGKFLEHTKKSNNTNKKEDEKKNTSSASPQLGSFGKYTMNKAIGLDTLSSDLTSITKTLDSVYNGWQTKETMKNTLSSVQSMYDRIGKYQEYQKQYGGTDLSDLQKTLKSTIDDWDNISRNYGKYKSAKEYNKAVKDAKAYNDSLKSADIGTLGTEITDLEKIYNVAKDYDKKATDFSKQAINMRNPSAVKPFSDTLKKLTDDRDAYLKSMGYSSMDELENLYNLL